MSAPYSNHAKGLALTTIGGLVLTLDVPLIRLAGGEHWTILLLRSSTTFASTLLIWLAWRWLRGSAPAILPGRPGLAVALLYGLASITFVTAVFNTSTANLVFILAFNTMFSALLSRVFLKERLRRPTLAAMAAMVGGVAIIVGDSVGTGNLFGDLMALASAFLIASAITVSRASGRDMGFAALVAVLVPMAIALVMVRQTGLRVEAPWWIVLNGAVVMPVAFFCLANAPKYIPGPEVAMFYLLETVLAPVWIWMIFSEVPTTASLIGGVILIVTLAAHSAWQIAEGRRRRAALAVRHPV